MTEHDVFANGQIGAQVDFLVHRGDARVLRIASAGEGLRLAVHFNGSGIDLVHAGERLDHRRFAGAVLSHKSVNLTGE